MPKKVEDELAEADRMHALAVRMRSQKDTASADLLDRKVTIKRRKAIARMNRRPKSGKSEDGKRAVV